MPASPSTTIRKKNDVRGSPYLSCIERENFYVGLPLTKMVIIVDTRHHFIHLIH